jgi:hypothetical protein
MELIGSSVLLEGVLLLKYLIEIILVCIKICILTIQVQIR